MSLILDALNRSREDRDQVPGLATQHYVDSDKEQSSHWRRYLPWLGLVAALAVIGLLLVERERGPSDSPQGTASDRPIGQEAPRNTLREAQSSTETPVRKQVAAPAREIPAQAKPSSIEQQAVVKADTAITAPAPARVEPAPGESLQQQAPAAAVTNSTGSTDAAAVADLYQQRVQASPAPQASVKKEPVKSLPAPTAEEKVESKSVQAEEKAQEQPIDIEKMILRARDELDNANLEEHSAPFIAQLSQQSKDGIPTIYYERHDYSGKPSQSSVVLNGRTLKAGSSVGSGVKVEEILPDSVVLSHQGTQFRLRALNSWINL